MTTTTTQHPAIDAQTKWLLTQVHATAFIVAWFFCVVVSILVARYTRVPRNGILNPQFWFQTHRILNYLALGLMLIGLLTIFIAHQWRWLGPVVGGDRNGSSTAWHTLFGVLSIGLAVIQPLNSFIRCDPSHQQRPIFNWIHRSIGAFAWLFAAVCISIACRLFTKRFTNPDAAFALCLTIIIGLFCFIIYMELLARKQEIRVGEYVNKQGEFTFSCNSTRLSLSFISLLLFVILLCALVLALCFMIWLKRPV